MKLRKLHIEDYKMFKDFDISFVDENDEALPIVVLAGVNGSGKTSLLEFIDTYQKKPYQGNSYIEVLKKNTNNKEFENLPSLKKVENLPSSSSILLIDEPELNFHPNLHLFNKSETSKNQIVYFSVDINIQNIKDFLPNYIENVMYAENLRPKEVAHRIRSSINSVFQGMKMEIEFEGRNGRKELFFRNNDGVKFIIDELSTGEKTLLSKVLYLYLIDFKSTVILIDEPELSLHPSWQNKVLKIYENFALKNNCQIIIATHSPHIIGSAKPEYIRLLKKEDNKIVAIDNIDRSYGLEFDKILTDIMGVENLRTPAVAKDIRRLWELLEDEEYKSQEYKKLYQKLEDILGSLDKDMVLARLEIARIKSRNAKTK